MISLGERVALMSIAAAFIVAMAAIVLNTSPSHAPALYIVDPVGAEAALAGTNQFNDGPLEAAPALDIPPECERAFNDAGPRWSKLVHDSIDKLVYLDAPSFIGLSNQDDLGMAWYDTVTDLRTVVVARDVPTMMLCSTLVHEAEHVRPTSKDVPYVTSETHAYQVQDQFLLEWAKAWGGETKDYYIEFARGAYK